MEQNKIETQNVRNPEAPAVNVQRIVSWYILNGLIMGFLVCGIYNNIDWMFNIVKFTTWANFIVWILILVGGKKSWLANRKKGFPVGAYTNGIYGVLFASFLAAYGYLGYAGMEITILIIQNTIYFSDEILDS